LPRKTLECAVEGVGCYKVLFAVAVKVANRDPDRVAACGAVNAWAKSSVALSEEHRHDRSGTDGVVWAHYVDREVRIAIGIEVSNYQMSRKRSGCVIHMTLESSVPIPD
jgi:hypothetical protein